MRGIGHIYLLIWAIVTLASAQSMAISQEACNRIYSKMSWAGVDFNNDKKPYCDTGAVKACLKGSTARLDYSKPFYYPDDTYWRFVGNEYFMCVPNFPSNFRAALCSVAGEKSSFRTADGLKLTFFRNGDSCDCTPAGYEKKVSPLDCRRANPFRRWSRPEPQAAPVARNQRPASNTLDNVDRTPTPRPARRATVAGSPDNSAARAEAQREAAERRDEAVRIEAERQAELQAQASARGCIDTEVSELTAACQTTSAAAEVSCKGTNSQAKESETGIQSSANRLISSGPARGAQQECFRSGTFAFGSLEGMTTVRDTCSTNVNDCTQSCGLDLQQTETNITNACSDEIGTREESLAYLREKVSGIGSGMEASKAVCQQANVDLAELSRLMGDVGNSVRKSAICACQLSAGGSGTDSKTGGCNAIASLDECAESPESTGCSAYAVMSVCSPESAAYDAKLCECSSNPQATGCNNGSVATILAAGAAMVGNGISSFAGNSASSPNLSASSFGGANSNSSAGPNSNTNSNIDLNGKPSGSESEPLVFGKSNENNSVASKGGGVTGVGSGGELQKSSEDVAPVEESTGIKGMFSMAKSFISKTLFKSSAGNGELKSAQKESVDFNRFKPRKFRGIASEDEDFNGVALGKSNMDIWIMMNKCSGGESCRSNLNNYITTP